MNIVYGAFCIAVGLAMALNLIIKSKNEKIDPTTIPWLLIGAAYFGTFINMAMTNSITNLNIYSFQIVTTIGLLWYAKKSEFSFISISGYITTMIGVFVVAWTVMSYVTGVDRFAILLPTTIIMMATSFLIAVFYFVRSDEEVLLKNLIGALFTAFGVIKVLYIIDSDGQSVIFYIGLFVLEYLMYMIMSFLLFFNRRYKIEISRIRNFSKMKDIINEIPMGYVILDRSGEVVQANDFIEGMFDKEGINKPTIYDIFNLFPVVDSFYYQIEWKRILVALDMRQRYTRTLEDTTELNLEFTYDFYQAEIISSNNPEIFLTITQKEIEVDEYQYEEKGDYIDHITGLPSKSDMQVYFDKVIGEASDGNYGVMLMSIDNYREMTRYVGIDLAEEFMAILISYIQEVDQIAYIGKVSADTFELITKNIETNQIGEIVNDLINNLQIPFKHKDYDIETVPLLGISIYPSDGVTHGELFKSAQISLSRANTSKGEQIQYSVPKVMDGYHNKTEIENRLKKALTNEEFYMVYQPQYDTSNEIFRGFEALLRWGDSERDIISPNLFIPIAEEMGLMNEIGEWVLRHAINKAVSWQRKYGQKFVMSVNVSGMQLEDDSFADLVKHLLDDFQYDPKLLELEITETRLIRSSEEVYKQLRKLKELGIKIALDDFGTGYSSLDYLRWLPFDVLKIDKSFIDNLNDDSIEREIIHSVITLVNKMNLETVAEGVENNEQLRSLQSSKCTYIQGYLFSKPLNENEVEGVLSKYEV